MWTPGRNEPCPCGSGQKYKRCCAGRDSAAARAAARPGAPLHEQDEKLVRKMVRYANGRFGWGWLREAADAFFDDPDFVPEGPDMQLFMPWAVHHCDVDGRPVREWFLEEKGAQLSEVERAWLLVQRPVVLTVWEVLEVREGVGLRVKDLLGGGGEHFVHEVLGSRQLRPRDAVLGRLVEHEGLAVFCGRYPQQQPPAEADEVVYVARKVLRVRGDRPIPREKLALEDTMLGLIHRPRQAVRSRAGRHKVDVLLKELENAEAGLPVEERMDFSGLRRELALEG